MSTDSRTVSFHGGQEWSAIDNFQCDFSVTTNGLGTPKAILTACSYLTTAAEHYPDLACEPAASGLAAWLGTPRNRLIMGNGASELIDIITRSAHPGGFKTAGYLVQGEDVQYREYLRSSQAQGRAHLPPSAVQEAGITAIINPSNPTGDFKPINELKQFIETQCRPGSTVMVDESMLMWYGPEWKEQSLVSHPDWLAEQERSRDVVVYVIHSWTKIWSCPGLRLGSVVCPSDAASKRLTGLQVPWSVNSAALKFTELVVKDTDYMEETWAVTRKWRQAQVSAIADAFPDWKCYGEEWLSWVWIDTGSPETAALAVDAARAAGTPIRWGKPGYNCPSFIRFGVREPRYQKVLMAALTKALSNKRAKRS